MSWNNVIPAELLLGVVTLEPKIVENPEVKIPEALVTDCLIKYTIDDYGITGNKDHPAFAELRQVLKARGYISIPEYACWNGDRVLKRFRFNGFGKVLLHQRQLFHDPRHVKQIIDNMVKAIVHTLFLIFISCCFCALNVYFLYF